MPKLPTVELHAAWVFTCEDCGVDTFVGCVTYEGVPLGVDPDDIPPDVDGMEGGWFSAPVQVVCGHCGSKFETESP